MIPEPGLGSAEPDPALGPDPALVSGLADLGAEALLVWAGSARDPDLAGFVGTAHLGECFLVAPVAGPARLAYLSPLEREEAAATGLALVHPKDLDLEALATQLPTREALLTEVIDRVLTRAGLSPVGLAPVRIALAGRAQAGLATEVGRRLEKAGWTILAGNRLGLLVRKRKRARELADARRTATGAATALRRVAALLAAAVEREERELWLGEERLTVGRLKVEVARSLAAFELEQPHGNLVAPAEEGAVPHNQGTGGRGLRVGESLIVDLFPQGHVYADVTRTFCVGRPPEALARAHAAVLGALERAREKIAPETVAAGLRGFSVQQAVCSHFGMLGYPTPISHPGTEVGYVHGLGHGVGFELHEYPSFRREAAEEGKLAVGDLLTLEPGLYDPAAGWAVRLEDLCHLGPDGLENLTPLPYDLDPRAWG